MKLNKNIEHDLGRQTLLSDVIQSVSKSIAAVAVIGGAVTTMRPHPPTYSISFHEK